MARRRKKSQRDYQAPIIKFSAVFAAVARWTGALLAAEGFSIIDKWLAWWIPASALLSAFMAVVEGWAFAYIFQAWWTMRNRERQYGVRGMSRALLLLTIFAAFIFILVLTPYIAAQAQRSNLYLVPGENTTMKPVLGSTPLLLAWSACVAASTISIVASVGIAQGAKAEILQIEKGASGSVCKLCGHRVEGQMWDHFEMHRKEIAEARNLPMAMQVLKAKYGENVDGKVVAEWQKGLGAEARK